MLILMSIIWTLLFFGFTLTVTSVFTCIYSLIYFHIFKKANYLLLVLLNLLIIIPAHLFYGGQITYTFKLTNSVGSYNFTFYIGFLLYLLIIFSCYIHKLIIQSIQKSKNNTNN